jgi:enoyl-CoA hydratase/carnithine racemase
MTTKKLKFFRMETDARGITVVTFDRPPVNAVSFEVYPDIRDMCEIIESTDQTRVVVLTSPPNSRAWCGGADVRDFLPLDHASRMARYAMINECLPSFYNLDRPVIGAINSHAVGVGLVLAAFCDMRVASRELAGGGSFFTRLNMPAGRIREMIYTGRRFMADEMQENTGFFNYIVPKDQVMAKSMELAAVIAGKSLAALKANKLCNNASESMSWTESYKLSQAKSADLTITKDAKEGIRAFLEKRAPKYSDH